jgi:hypothetical protein
MEPGGVWPIDLRDQLRHCFDSRLGSGHAGCSCVPRPPSVSEPGITTHSTRARIARLSCARPSGYYVLSRRVNSGVMPLRFERVINCWVVLMNQDYTVRALINYNLEDAQEELTKILELIRPDSEIDEDEFNSRMAHLYKHLNIAWNMRNASNEEVDSASGEQLDSWGRFPTDIEPL